jgi:thiol-disulfide isomerase/thioredoxin
MRLTLLTLLAALPVFAQPACETPQELRRFYNTIKNAPGQRVAMLKDRLAADPDDLYLNRWYIESPMFQPGALAAEYKSKLDGRPDDPVFLYLYGRAVMGADTPKAIESFQRAIAKDPKFPWTYEALRDIYASPGFRDGAKVGANILELASVCPSDVDAFTNLQFVTDPALVKQLAAAFRKSVEGRSTSGVANRYPSLWAVEFRVADSGDYERLRKQVAEDMKRAKELDPSNTATQIQGFKLIGDAAAAKALEETAAPRQRPPTFNDTFNQWEKEHPYPKPDAPPEAAPAFLKLHLAASEQWVKDFPDDLRSWYWRFVSLANVKETPDSVIETEGADFLARINRQQVPASTHPYQIDLTEIWAQRGIRLKEIGAIAQAGLREMDAEPASRNDMFGPAWASNLKQPPMQYTLAFERFRLLEVQAEAARKLDDWDRVRGVAAEMKAWLDAHPGDYPMPEFDYLQETGQVAEHDGKKLDALSYYQRALSRFNYSKYIDIKGRARALWAELGGTSEGFDNWSYLAFRKPSIASSPSAEWTRLDRPLTALNAGDLNGKQWTITDLKGKATFINIWATWCGPCRDELPQVQKLYELTKDRKDIQVITIDMDDNPGLVGPFLADHHYTFPVLRAKPLIDEMVPSFSIPRNWVSDPAGTLRLESVGFDTRIPDWPAAMIAKLADVLK